MFTANRSPSTPDLRKFGLAMVFGFGVLGAVAWSAPWISAWWNGRPATGLLAWTARGGQWTALGMWALGVLLGIAGFAPRAAATKVYVAWMSIVVPIGFVMSMIFLSLMFFILLPVFALIVRSGDPLRRKLPRTGSYWEDVKPHPATLERMSRLS